MLAAVPPPPPLHAWPTVPITDGHSYAVWNAAPPYRPYVTTAAVRVLRDDQPGTPDTAATLTAPPGCELQAASTTAIGYWCQDAELPQRFEPRLQDPATGTTTVAPAARIIGDEVQREGDATFWLIGLGTAAIEVGAGGNHISVDRVRALDGTLRHRVTRDPRRVLSLDAPGAAVRLCAPLALPDDAERRTAQYRPPWLLSVRDGRLLLRHCGSRRVRTLDDHVERSGLRRVLNGRYAAWSEPGAVHVRRLGAATTTRTYRARRLVPSTYPYSLTLSGTDRRLWVGDDDEAVMMAP